MIKNKILILMGPPGSGKGSYSKKISLKYKIPTYSTGEHLRNIIKSPNSNENSEVISTIKSKFNIDNVPSYLSNIIDKGGLISKNIMDQLMISFFSQLSKSDANSCILDGYPRTIEQASSFESTFNRKIDLAININQDYDIITKKLLGRRVCTNCFTGYNVSHINEKGYVMPSLLPKKEGVCDKCGSSLSLRADDTEEVIKERLKTYDLKSKSVIDYYDKKGVLVNSEMKRGYDDIDILYKIVNERLISI